MKVIALKSHTFKGKQRKMGDEFEVDEKPVLDIMIKLGNVEVAPSQTVSEQKIVKPRGRYNRRDLTAEQ